MYQPKGEPLTLAEAELAAQQIEQANIPFKSQYWAWVIRALITRIKEGTNE